MLCMQYCMSITGALSCVCVFACLRVCVAACCVFASRNMVRWSGSLFGMNGEP